MGILEDVRYSIRLLLKTPVTTAVAVLSLALGIGANTSIFSLINALTLRPLAVRDPQQLVSIATARPGVPFNEAALSLPMFEGLRRDQRAFSGMFLWDGGGVDNFEVNGVPFIGNLARVSGDFYATLGVQPLLGRLITTGDGAVAVLDYRCWKARYRGDPNVVGQTIRANGAPLTIIGVTPEYFHGLIVDIAPDAIVPFAYSGDNKYRQAQSIYFNAMGRLASGVTLQQARAQLEARWPGVRAEALPPTFQDDQRANYLKRQLVMQSGATGNSFLRGRMTRPLGLLMGLVALVLFIACVNLANLMLARAAARTQEIGISAALGAGLWRIGRQLAIEGLVLSTAGALCGLVLSVWASRTLAHTVWSGFVPLAMDTDPDARVLAFTATIAMATGIAFGLAPLWNISRTEALRRHNRSVRSGTGRFGQVLVSAQIAITLVLLAGAALFVRSLSNLYNQNPGYRRDGVLLMQLFPNPGVKKIPNRTAYFRNLADQLARVPGVRAVSYSHMGPGLSYEYKEPVSPRNSSAAVPAAFELIGPGFFDLLDMHVLAGRQFIWRDDENSPRVVVINESLARQLFPGQSALGRHVKIGNDPTHQDLVIVGVVNSASLWTVQSHEPPAYFLPLAQESEYDQPTVDLRVDGDPTQAAVPARAVLASLGKHFAISVETVNHRMDRMLVSERLIAVLSAFFGALAMLLASIGLYGVMSLAVTARTSEIGVRMALGAQRADVVVMILRQVLLTAGIGLAVGIPVTLGASRFVQSMIYGLPARDPGTLVLASAVLLAAALLAGYLPARYASRIDPIAALRGE
jgi:predicted permease